jgi:hypothetical protein
MNQRIRESFDAYLDRVGLADAGPEQKRELRRAFYAGCWEVLCAVWESPVEFGGVFRADVVRLGAMTVECEEFAGRVLEGKDWT